MLFDMEVDNAVTHGMPHPAGLCQTLPHSVASNLPVRTV
jgi:hypothetical protein